MGRKKSRPVRSGAISEKPSTSKPDKGNAVASESEMADNSCEVSDLRNSFYVDVVRCNLESDEHLDIAEVVLHIVDFADEMTQNELIELGHQKSDFSLRFHLLGVGEGSFRLGHWPVIPADHIVLEYGVFEEKHTPDDIRKCTMLFSGVFDGPDDAVSSFIHLVSQKILTLRLIEEVGSSRIVPSLRFRVEILKYAFDACESLLEVTRHLWRKSMMNLMSWLRPEVTTSEAIYGLNRSNVENCDVPPAAGETVKQAGFNAAEFYEAIKPSKDEPMLKEELPDLLPHLRPYQRRAAYWMVQREKGVAKVSSKVIQPASPFCVPVTFLDRDAKLFYNPFNGNVSWHPESSSIYVSGGILADEMGLGKTVELLACIFAHRRLSLHDSVIPIDNIQDINCQIKRPKRERVECVCGAASENPRYKGLWVQCDICDAWQHADCVGYSPKRKSTVSHEVFQKKGSQTVLPIKSTHYVGKKRCRSMIESAETYVCSLCSDLMEAAKVKISTGATLIVCPAPILAQWHSEISRHTRSGSLKICIYEGARNLGSSVKLTNDMTELAASDIVLTTYDVLKEDLSHDSDRHDGDRRFMRFQKRYPVLPTLLTRIHWWRLCLDEAQMVESNTASVTEMAMRLKAEHRWCITGTPIQRKLDDMYGLLRFLRASPFDTYRWWVEVIRDPYERRDVVAMEFVHELFQKFMWRSSKVHVSDELQLPLQEENLTWLTFSPVEEHFYQKQHETCVRYAHEIIRSCKRDTPERNSIPGLGASCSVSISHNEVEKLLFSLLKLRQACCHPQVGSSGLCSLQSSPLTMEEILQVLIGKAKIEGEEALRKIVVALNGLAGIAVIENDNNQAMSLYKEALVLAVENCNDFRLDPLLSIHIHHNLSELLRLSPELSPQCPLMSAHSSENSGKRKTSGFCRFDQYYVKRQRTNDEKKPVSTANDDLQYRKLNNDTSDMSNPDVDGATECGAHNQVSSRCYADVCLKKTCENMKQKYLSAFISKLSLAQEEFKNSYMQVSSMSKECKSQSMIWWLHALDFIDQNKSSEGLLAKIDQAISSAGTSSKSFKVTSRIRNISGLKYTIQTGLDFLETSRQALIHRIMDIDQTMENPKDVDFERKRYCPKCSNGNGSLCIHCELDELFQVYEAGLFLLKKASNGAVIASEEAIEMQKEKAALNRFFSEREMSVGTNTDHEKNRQRLVKGGIQVSKSASPLEITLGVIKSFSKTILGRQSVTMARKHLILFEAMRKEFAQARSLQVAQSQLFGAYDEIKMSTSRMRLQEAQDEATCITVLSREELVSHSIQYSSDKLLSMASLSRIKGQLRYLKGLMVSTQKTQEQLCLSSMPQDTAPFDKCDITTVENKSVCKTGDEACPICHENLSDKRMMFPCGHVICCKCCLQLTEKVVWQQKWLMCPTCRQHTDIEHIAYVDESKDKSGSPRISSTLQEQDIVESTIRVHGSYGTKIGAVTRRILLITSTDPEAKVLVFSSWNDVLDVLAHALDANNITYIRMKGGRKSHDAIAKFKGLQSSVKGHVKIEEKSKSNTIRVLLILIQHGANGLNILEAQHVILVEPLINPAAEAQAISRVHRVGQEKKTFVHRFLVKDTVEESIYKLNRSRSVNSVISTRGKHQDQTILTIRDVESLFPMKEEAENPDETEDSGGSFRHLPPAVAAGLAAERRLTESQNNAT